MKYFKFIKPVFDFVLKYKDVLTIAVETIDFAQKRWDEVYGTEEKAKVQTSK